MSRVRAAMKRRKHDELRQSLAVIGQSPSPPAPSPRSAEAGRGGEKIVGPVCH
jgi:hypothetical protein